MLQQIYIELFFGYCHRENANGMLYDLGLQSFNTLILHVKHRFKNNYCNMVDNDIAALFRVPR